MANETMPRRRTTRKLAGAALRSYLNGVLDAEAELAAPPRKRLSETLMREVAQARVRLPLPNRRRLSSTAAAPVAAAAEAEPDTTQRGSAVGQDAARAAPVAAPPTAAPTFNPFAFSVVVVMTRGGREALMGRLEQIGDAGDLRKLAASQHIALPAGVTEPAELRRAIVDGAALRIAERRAAAS